MKILVIGGGNFIGLKILENLLAKRHAVTVFNRGTHIEKMPLDKIKFIKGDREISFGIKEHFDAVIDVCAYNGGHTEKALKELSFDYFLHISTVAVYKKPAILPLREETSPIGPWAEWENYGKGKLECEKALGQSSKRIGILRPVYVLGQGNNIDREHFIYRSIKQGEKIFLPSKGEAVAQFVFVDEVAEAVSLLVKKQAQGAFNCCGDEAITLSGLVAAMAEILGKKPLVEFSCGIGQVLEKNQFPFDDVSFFCDNAKLKKIGVKFTPLLAGLKRDFLNYYKSI